jgi:hypothetical protein
LPAAPDFFHSRFAPGAVNRPGKPVASDHAGCSSRSGALGEAGFKPEGIRVVAEVALENIQVQGWTITHSYLVLVGKVPAIKLRRWQKSPRRRKTAVPLAAS